MKKNYLFILIISVVAACSSSKEVKKERLPNVKASAFDVVWNTPSTDESGSMPLGNGDIGTNVWMTPDGVLHFYLAKTDAVNENAQLLKLGKVELSLSPSPFGKEGTFEQALRLADGTIKVSQKDTDGNTLAEISLWVDAHHPTVQIEIDTQEETKLEAKLINWRDSLREMEFTERHAAYGVTKKKGPIYIYPDTVFSLKNDELAWAHHNEKSIWRLTFEKQNLGHLIKNYKDPLMHHTFGGLIKGEDLAKVSDRALASKKPAKRHSVQVQIKSGQNADLKNWLQQLQAEATQVAEKSVSDRYLAHQKWWRNFWERSYLIPSGTLQADTVARGYTLQRFVSACAGRGVLPIKFNGSLFNVGGKDEATGFAYNADYRRWGGPYWFQNTRLVYWPMLESGDFEMMRPLFEMYLRNLSYAKERVSHYFEHEGAMFPETQYFWGAYAQDNYGWEEDRVAAGLTDSIGTTVNTYIRYHYEGSLELVSMMLDYYHYTKSETFAQDTLLPLANAAIKFYEQHYPRTENGEILFYPAQAIETFWNVENPTPVISGLRWTLTELLRLPSDSTGETNRTYWEEMLSILPEIPLAKNDSDKQVILPAENILNSVRKNDENPEMYAVYPFRIYGLGKPGLTTAIHTFHERAIKGNVGWFQDETQAAYLGLATEAKEMLEKRAGIKNEASRFPAFWGPNRDWTPDQDHGGNLVKSLQVMVIQPVGDSILLFPAWPKEWDVSFKLHAPQNTIVKARLENGQMTHLSVTPKEREDDIINCSEE